MPKYHASNGWHYVSHDNREYYIDNHLIAVAQFVGDRTVRNHRWVISILETPNLLNGRFEATTTCDTLEQGAVFIKKHQHHSSGKGEQREASV